MGPVAVHIIRKTDIAFLGPLFLEILMNFNRKHTVLKILEL